MTGVRTVDLRSGEDTIRLGQLLKLVDAVPTGAQVKDVLSSGTVRVNGEPRSAAAASCAAVTWSRSRTWRRSGSGS